ncbi:putative ATP-dependent DNA helicase [Actinacidiphila reveromycinica]|uniref:DNA 3'-5' helicase n=1 Tax=Actinacidiphila reveromycinica TaxID=659352 RepID=A0A7U3VQP1_9ACTN|nr:ATP-dependent DNA helicase [Streptomyces sp. SN-593]BBA99939.1 putative ATP-dependent DNA helicase [Streptomyces sp. SN-593]
MRAGLVSAAPPVLDASQRAVVEHGSGPLLVLAGPGTGKTTTLVEAVMARVRAGTPADRVLVLTYGRAAAVELRDRMAARAHLLTGGAAAAPQATTFHSFCYGLLRAHQDPELFAEPVRLMSGPEQDLMVRELLAGQARLAREGRAKVGWPDDLRAALTTRGFADEVRAVLARTRELGLAPRALADFARRIGRPDWLAAAAFLQEYLDVADLQGVIDYTELVHRAVRLVRRPEVHAALAGRYDAVFVDEYQDTDAAQVRLLRALAGQGRTLVAFGDPDQSIYAFRGADVNGILDFPTAFPGRDGRPAPVRVLTGNRRAAAALLTAAGQLAGRMALPRLPAAAARAHRAPTAHRPGGVLAVRTHPTPGAELDAVADALRRAHLEDGIPWTDMAVLTRTTAALPTLRRALASAGVPIDLAPSDTPLHADPAVAPLLLALRVAAEAAAREAVPAPREAPREMPVPPPLTEVGAAQGAEEPGGAGGPGEAPEEAARVADEFADEFAGRGAGAGAGADGDADGGDGDTDGDGDGGAGESEVVEGDAGRGAGNDAGTGGGPGLALTVEDALTLLTSPLGGMDSADLRKLGRALREEERAAGATVPRPSDQLIAEAVARPERLAAHDASYARGARRVGAQLAAARAGLAAGGTVEDALWALWNGSPWPARLERAALRGGPAGRNADRDLDAVCALFETVARAEERTGGRGALNLIDELSSFDIVADTLGGRVVRPDAVRLMTAHRAKGLEWPLVVVAGVQEGVWPDLRRRGSLLEADRIGRDGLAPPLTPGALLAEERRLFYVAVTRARDRLLVTAVKSGADEGDQPSRFLAELGVEPVHVGHRPRRPLAVAPLVAELRATTVDPSASPELRDAAARRLARMASLTDDGHPLVPTAHPDRWWGLYEPTRSEVPVRDRDQPVVLSGSALDQLANTCALQWFLGREVKAEPPSTAAQGFGNVVHVLADEVASGRAPADLDVLMARLDSVWDALAFDAPWKSRQERENARAALERFLRWHVMERGREAVAGEHAFDVTLEAGDAQVRIRGSMDRVETDAEGRAYVVDFKTGRAKPTAKEVERHPQLAVYQLAVREGAVDPLFGGARPHPGGAELVQLRVGANRKEGGDVLPAVQRQEPLEGEWARDLLAEAAGRVLDERFTPAAGHHCAHCAFRSACTARPEGRHVVE